jgi:hypothetical protein
MDGHLPNDRMFLVQYGVDASPSEGRWCGRVEHIQSGASQRFVSLEGLQDFVARMLREVGGGRDETEANCHSNN